jgi:hexosaminidase
MIASYPQLSCIGEQVEVSPNFGIHKEILCAGNESTYDFLESVFNELTSIFPSRFIHLGGDEVPKSRWKKCPECQKRIRDNKLEDETHLQIYFFNRIATFLESKDRIAIGWNQISHKELIKTAIIHFWLGNKKRLEQSFDQGHQIINSDFFHTYLDHSYLLTPLRKAYNFEPTISKSNNEGTLGLEALAWTEWIENQDRMDYQVHPRLSALAETGWTPENIKEYDGFKARLQQLLYRMDLMGVRYASEKDWDPPWYKRLFGFPSIVVPQRRTR